MRFPIILIFLSVSLIAKADKCPSLDSLKKMESKVLVSCLTYGKINKCPNSKDYLETILKRINPFIYKREYDDVEIILKELENKFEKDSSHVAEIEFSKGNLMYFKDEYNLALNHYKKANLLLPHDSLYIKKKTSNLLMSARMLSGVYDIDGALVYLNQALAILKKKVTLN